MMTGAERTDPRPGLEESEEGGVPVIALVGDWDFAQAAELRERFDGLASDALIVDLRGTTFLDSTILSVIVRVERRLARDGGGVSVRLPEDGLIKRVFAMMSLDRLFDDAPYASSHFARVERPANVLEKNARSAAGGSPDLRTSS
jgi:anti-anti-sigma factor